MTHADPGNPPPRERAAAQAEVGMTSTLATMLLDLARRGRSVQFRSPPVGDDSLLIRMDTEHYEVSHIVSDKLLELNRMGQDAVIAETLRSMDRALLDAEGVEA